MSVPNICLGCEEEGKKTAKNLKNQKKEKVEEDLENNDEKVYNNNNEHKLTE